MFNRFLILLICQIYVAIMHYVAKSMWTYFYLKTAAICGSWICDSKTSHDNRKQHTSHKTLTYNNKDSQLVSPSISSSVSHQLCELFGRTSSDVPLCSHWPVRSCGEHACCVLWNPEKYGDGQTESYHHVSYNFAISHILNGLCCTTTHVHDESQQMKHRLRKMS